MLTEKKFIQRRMPAEWERQYAVQLTWPNKDTDWAPILKDITAVYEQMAQEISKREKLIVVDDLPHNDTWARDHGFISVIEQRGEKNELLLLDFKFNGWGEKFPAQLDNKLNKQIYDLNMVKGTYESHLDFVLEGGSIESDGKGTLFTTSYCLLSSHRNQPMNQQDIEQRLKQWLGAKRVVWIDHGLLEGDDTDGHIDTLVRVAPDDTLLYIGCDDKDDEQYQELSLMEQQLKTLKTLDGQPYKLLRLPMPRPIYDEQGERLPATYANYLVINGAVLYPTYGQPDKDDEARDIIQQAFPDREMVPIDCRAVIWQHGSLHCCTMQYYEDER